MESFNNRKFLDFNSLPGLKKLDNSFLEYLKEHNSNLYENLIFYRQNQEENSDFLIELSYIVDDFIAQLFSIEDDNQTLKQSHEQFDPIYECRRKFIQRYVIKKYPKHSLTDLNFESISTQLSNLIGKITQDNIAESVLNWQNNPNKYANQLNLIAKYCAFMVHNNSSLPLFDIPREIDTENHLRSYKIDQLKENNHLGYNYRDNVESYDQPMMHVKYCIYCHKQKKDSCSHGMKYAMPEKTELTDKKGCPLEQKISEMNLLKSAGFNIASLAMIIIDNPLVAVTGHRICNDCMKACIYQKQTPVNIPLIESNILEQVLSLPWGVEIYLLLTKWNPLNVKSPLPTASTNRNILVVGLGPAGFALSHYLLREGHNVTAIDGMKISTLDFDPNAPIKNWQKIKTKLSEKIPQGFGGVAEYGITHRWDKNNLILVRLMLERNKSFKMHGGVRMGSNLTTTQAFDAGFDHIALCLGAGSPKYIGSSDYFLKGVKSAADFLMNLQQGGAYLEKSNATLIARMPAIVIGCGLTAIDSAVELLQYYPTQVERFLSDFEQGNMITKSVSPSIAQEFIEHAQLFRQAKNDAQKLKIMEKLGGVTICYRGEIKNSPAYKLNHEEIEHAMAIGVKFEENLSITRIKPDESGHVKSVLFSTEKEIEAKTVLIAIGTNRNDFLDIKNIEKDNLDIFKNIDNSISHFGDCNWKYAGSVVKAIASVKNNYQAITRAVNKSEIKNFHPIDENIKSIITKITNLSTNIIEIVVKAPYAAENYQEGQIFRLQNHREEVDQIMKPIALTPVAIDKKNGLISFIIYKIGKSSKLCDHLQLGEEVILMGPTGQELPIIKDKKILIITENIGSALMIPIAQKLQENNCQITFFAGYKKASDRIYQKKIEQFSDHIIWNSIEDKISKNRDSDFTMQGGILENLRHANKLGLLSNIDQVICNISKDLTTNIVNQKNILFNDNVKITGNINAPMQCMMKGICGQCITQTNDKKGYVFACACQNYDAEKLL